MTILFEKRFYNKLFLKNWDTPQLLISFLESKGFKEIGRGWYSVVYSLPNSSYVIKINSGDFDYGYAYFIDMCIKNKDNIHLIDIQKYKEYSLVNNPFYFVLLPKLIKIYDSMDSNVSTLDKLCHGEIDIENVSKNISDMYLLLNSIDKERYMYDICSSNIMLDNKGNYVLTDPIRKIKK